MCDQKIKLWKKFEETFPNGMKKTSFMGRLANCSNIKYRDDIGGLCLTCNDYGYIPFESLIAIARNTFLQKDQLVSKKIFFDKYIIVIKYIYNNRNLPIYHIIRIVYYKKLML